MITPSQEQYNIITALQLGHNVIVNSVAGSGKTKTITMSAESMPDKRLLAMTYNRKLMDETNERCACAGIENLNTYTYHSFVNRFYAPCRDDKGLVDVISKDLPLKYTEGIPDIIVLDEAQDLTLLLYQMVVKIYRDFEAMHLLINDDDKPNTFIAPTLCVIGDQNQSIYEYAGSDARYITRAEDLFARLFAMREPNYRVREWKRFDLNQSYRITKPMAGFLNECILAEPRIVSHKDGAKVDYYTINMFSTDKLVKIVMNVLAETTSTGKNAQKTLKYGAGDVFILAPSIKTGNKSAPINKFSNELSRAGIKIGYTSDKGAGGVDVHKGKLLFSSFHQSKGLERKVVVLWGFDTSYFKYFAKSDNALECNNPLYVALTRARERLIILASHNTEPFAFLARDKMTAHCNIYGAMSKLKKDTTLTAGGRAFGTTELIAHLQSNVITRALTFITHARIQSPEATIAVPCYTKQHVENGDTNAPESVSDINGLLIPLWYEWHNTGTISILQQVKDINGSPFEAMGDFAPIRKEFKSVSARNIRLEEFVKMCVIWSAHKDNLIYRYRQITSYDWITTELIDQCIKRLSTNVSKYATYEVATRALGDHLLELHNCLLSASIDCIDAETNTLWEFKCVQKITDDHILQLAIYCYIHQCVGGNTGFRYKLFNIFDNTIIELSATNSNLKTMIKYLIGSKLGLVKTDKLSDEMFLYNARLDTNVKKVGVVVAIFRTTDAGAINSVSYAGLSSNGARTEAVECNALDAEAFKLFTLACIGAIGVVGIGITNALIALDTAQSPIAKLELLDIGAKFAMNTAHMSINDLAEFASAHNLDGTTQPFIIDGVRCSMADAYAIISGTVFSRSYDKNVGALDITDRTNLLKCINFKFQPSPSNVPHLRWFLSLIDQNDSTSLEFYKKQLYTVGINKLAHINLYRKTKQPPAKLYEALFDATNADTVETALLNWGESQAQLFGGTVNINKERASIIALYKFAIMVAPLLALHIGAFPIKGFSVSADQKQLVSAINFAHSAGFVDDDKYAKLQKAKITSATISTILKPAHFKILKGAIILRATKTCAIGDINKVVEMGIESGELFSL